MGVDGGLLQGTGVEGRQGVGSLQMCLVWRGRVWRENKKSVESWREARKWRPVNVFSVEEANGEKD